MALTQATFTPRVHGGPDAQGVAAHDFSTNSNACGPCPAALVAVQQADATHYPDPAYTALRARLAAFHGVAPERIVLAGSASEFIYRITALAAQRGVRTVALPAHSYGDYAQAAQAWGLAVLRSPSADAGLQWACEPGSPLGQADPALAVWRSPAGVPGAGLRVLDCAYAPLRLAGQPTLSPAQGHAVWQLFSPNKALGLTGVRAAYAIAPADAGQTAVQLEALAPSWVLGAHGVALLQAWTQAAVHTWLQASLQTLRDWKQRQLQGLQALGWSVQPGGTPFFCARPPAGVDVPALCARLRSHGIRLRDCASFGLPGRVRLGVRPPPSQNALFGALRAPV